MATITIRNLPDEIHKHIKTRATKNQRSTEAEVRAILATIAAKEAGEGFGQHLRSFFIGCTGDELSDLRDQTPVEGADFE